MKNWKLWAGALVVSGMMMATAWAEEAHEFPWYFSPSLGVLDFEGDEEVDDGGQATLRLGYDSMDWLSVEAGLMITPTLDETFRTDWQTGKKISRLEEATGDPDVDSATAIGVSVDALYHFTRWERLDPYLAAGVGGVWYSEDFGSGPFDPAVRYGAGVMYHFNDEWGVRADWRSLFAGSDTEANSVLDAGVIWHWGAGVPPKIVAAGGPLDSDGDGLLDDEEAQYRTDPFDADSDDDGLLDGPEVKTYKTDPRNPDTDFDGLKDGVDEVYTYKTDPTLRDTDNGGVADGHEVIEDGTNPLNPADDLILFELYIQFDYDKADIKEQYYGDLDKIVRVLRRNAQASARIEGHADKLKKSRGDYNKKLSQRRAEAVKRYLVEFGKIDAARLEPVGYGFERPKAANDPVYGNPVNRRVEVYIRGADGEKKLDTVVEKK
jgi:outer membrane protein OmpA-like peptidoglycan-associated protein/opacity protein-like surface antigen